MTTPTWDTLSIDTKRCARPRAGSPTSSPAPEHVGGEPYPSVIGTMTFLSITIIGTEFPGGEVRER